MLIVESLEKIRKQCLNGQKNYFFDTQNKKTVTGRLEGVCDNSLKLELNDEIKEIAFSSIIQANLII